MRNKVVMPFATGPVTICDFWTFIQEVPKYVTREACAEIARLRKLDHEVHGRFRYMPDVQDGVYSTTHHILKMNPASVLVELKKTTTLIERKSETIDFEQMLDTLCIRSANEFGEPTHFFPIGKNRYALVNVNDDVKLYTKGDFSQSLICFAPNRNFQIYAPYLKVGKL